MEHLLGGKGKEWEKDLPEMTVPMTGCVCIVVPDFRHLDAVAIVV